MKERMTGTNPAHARDDLPDSLSRVVTYCDSLVVCVNELIAANKTLMETNKRLMESNRQKKLLWTPQEAAGSMGFTLKAFTQAPWHTEIPVKKVGIKNRYRPEDVKLYVDNLKTLYTD
jgi:hypothetical protein